MTEQEKIELRSRIESVNERIAAAAEKAGRKAEDITLVAATKMNDAERVRFSVECGIKVCGENRVQELLEKYEQGAYRGADLQFIGTLQTNKVKYLIGKVSLIQSVSSLKLADAIAKEAVKRGVVQDILLEVNIGKEASKSGFLKEEIMEAAAALGENKAVCVKGLMAIPPVSRNQRETSYYFEELYKLFVDISEKKYDNVNMDCLSMGMTSDFETAIMYGANMVRVGTAIFGPRYMHTS